MNDLKPSEFFLVHVGTTETTDLDRYSSGWIQLAPPVLVTDLKPSEFLFVNVGTTETSDLDRYSSGRI